MFVSMDDKKHDEVISKVEQTYKRQEIRENHDSADTENAGQGEELLLLLLS